MKFTRIAGAAGALVGLCLSNQAATLAPGGSGSDPTQAPGPPPLETRITRYHFGDLNGTITSWVVRDPANPLGGLSLYYQINNTGSEDIGRFSIASLRLTPGVPIEVTTIIAPFGSGHPGGVAPTSANRSSGGNVVGFNFIGASQINQGQWSEILVINTSYQSLGLPRGSVIDNKVFDAGISVVPESSTIIAASLLLIPFAASALRIVRKR